ncbi:stalk domain-containing protein [Paenibacillus elgii]|uniref:stalk domain-containing protein n=1 Tax=Paenibacillus elgii TaxID=189691 RepID=UPI00203C79B0|nr:stalk domain-containing protein [Paenibacillus elgii]MCM3274157.1 stalk domain-containing protein [Paenibacillus elgii]
MKKFVAGVLVGAVVATAGSALAAQNETISATFAEFNILVNGKQASLSDKPVVIEGSSYLPVRSISNTLGYQVQYDGESRTISLANDGNKYLKTDESNAQPAGKVEDNKVVINGSVVKDLKGKYSKEGKLNLDLIKAAIDKKELQLNTQDEETGNSLVFYAIIENNYPVFDYLAKSGANLELQNKEGKTPLHIAVIEKSSFYMGELLSKYKVPTKVKDNSSKMPIDYTDVDSTDRMSLRGYDK